MKYVPINEFLLFINSIVPPAPFPIYLPISPSLENPLISEGTDPQTVAMGLGTGIKTSCESQILSYHLLCV